MNTPGVVSNALGIIDVIRKQSSMYTTGGNTSYGLALGLEADALRLGATSVRIDFVEDWYLVSADLDWLSLPLGTSIPPTALFTRHVHEPQFGPNSMRSEVIVAALAACCHIATPTTAARVFGDVEVPTKVTSMFCPDGYSRTVAFLPHPANKVWSGS